MPNLIEANDISVYRNKNTILKDISLKIEESDFITIVGPNGAGKSMLVKCLMGFYKPDEGRIKKKQSLKIGYLPQKMAPEYTIPLNVKRFLTLRKKTNEAELSKIIKETGIEQLLESDINVISGGEMQRVLLARALIGEPEVLILDEPAQNLDVKGQLQFYKLLDKIYKEKQLSIVMVSHDLHLVMSSTKRVICLYKHICCSGEPHLVSKDPEFTKLFGEDMAKMMAVYNHHHSHQHENIKPEEQND